MDMFRGDRPACTCPLFAAHPSQLMLEKTENKKKKQETGHPARRSGQALAVAGAQVIAAESSRGVASSDACGNCRDAPESAGIIFSDIIGVAVSNASAKLEGPSAISDATVSQAAVVFIASVVDAAAGAVAEVRPAKESNCVCCPLLRLVSSFTLRASMHDTTDAATAADGRFLPAHVYGEVSLSWPPEGVQCCCRSPQRKEGELANVISCMSV